MEFSAIDIITEGQSQVTMSLLLTSNFVSTLYNLVRSAGETEETHHPHDWPSS